MNPRDQFELGENQNSLDHSLNSAFSIISATADSAFIVVVMNDDEELI